MKTKLRPVSNHVLIRPDSVEKTTKGGLHLPEVAQNKQLVRYGEVLAVGDGIAGEYARPCYCKAGDRVAYMLFAADDVEVEGEKLILLDDTQVRGIIEG